MSNNHQHEDVFEDVLNLEDQYYREGYELGIEDGSKSGRSEGRIFGLQKGFEKFVEMGRLNGRAAVWESRLDRSFSATEPQDDHPHAQLPALAANERLKKHVDRLATLSDSHDLSTENSEDAVSDFDDRLKDAKAKLTLIARMVNEDEYTQVRHDTTQSAGSQGRTLRVRRSEPGGAARPTGEMEDFVGLPQG